MTIRRRVLEELGSKILFTPSGCAEWIGYKSKDGYGHKRHNGRMTVAHRVVYEVFVRAVADEMDLDHLCRNRSCVNPEHLEPVSHRENVMRGTGLSAMRARQTHCSRGHDLSGDNLYVRPGRPSRECRLCKRANRKGPRVSVSTGTSRPAQSAFVGGEWHGRREAEAHGFRDAPAKLVSTVVLDGRGVTVETCLKGHSCAVSPSDDGTKWAPYPPDHRHEFDGCVRDDVFEPAGEHGAAAWIAQFYCPDRPANWSPVPCGWNTDNGPCYCNGKAVSMTAPAHPEKATTSVCPFCGAAPGVPCNGDGTCCADRIARSAAPAHPAPLCPACAARMEQARQDGKAGIVVCGDCAARQRAFEQAEAAARKAEGHPPPWAWGTNGDDWLRAANGEIVVKAGDGDTWPANAYVGELVRGAPEMEELLRDWLDEYGPLRTCCAVSIDSPGDHDEDCEVGRTRAILDRLDEARKAGG